MSTPLPRVVVVDDDPLIRRLIAMCLEGQPIELVSCEGVAQAVSAMRERPAQVVITDLMMPHESGLELLRRMRDEPALAPGARVAVFSAGLQASDRQALAALGVSRMLDKPVATQALSGFVAEAIAAGQPPRAQATDESVLCNFGGDAALLEEFRADCLEQFPLDLANGDVALDAGDLRTLRRVAHDLKSVLRLLGETRGADLAAAVEQAAAHGQTAAAGVAWQALRRVLEAFVANPQAN